MIKLEYRLFERRASQPSIETPLKGWSSTLSHGRWLDILRACEIWLKRYPCSRLKLTLTVEYELPTTLEALPLEDCLQVFPNLALERISKTSKKAYDQSLSLIEDIN